MAEPIFTPEKEIEIQKYIDKMGFTSTIDSIRETYKEYKKGYYVSFTARQIINNVIEKP
jgi:hypothetical protein